MDIKFGARVDEESGRLLMDGPSAFHRHNAKFKGKRVEVIVRLPKTQRSLDQNAWCWGVAYPVLAEHLGYDKDEVESLHYALIAKCFGEGYDDKLGVTIPNKRSSHLTTKEFSEYMEWLVRFAAKEFNCLIPLPNEVEVSA